MFSSSLLALLLTLVPLSTPQETPQPQTYVLRLSSPTEPLIDGSFLQPGPPSDPRIFAQPSNSTPNALSISTAWSFTTSPNLNFTSSTTNSSLTNITEGVELTNSTAQLIILGRKFYMWDPEPAMLQMLVEPLANAKTGYPGEAWPSAYISVEWEFPVVFDDGSGSVAGSMGSGEADEDERLWLGFGFDHGSWRAQRDMLFVGDGKWDVFWWNGTANPEVAVDNVPVGIEIISVPPTVGL
ncbi:hypothetical protein G7Y89_g12858 [Cudoniella acicularis]|uniref:Uncharacterized protein n=1 Tax=Cudoniella acicularis TaxID=354080 RepID=A0A8H4RAF0_9HELO|nr:hypothetical protein G7Y89_g12858 [Cudoniella acicularis]